MTTLAFIAVGITLGLALGLFGGGGGILAVPLLLLVGIPPDEAATTSLVVVAAAAIGGIIPHARVGRVAWREGVVFGALGVLAAIVGSRLALRTDDAAQLWAFAVLMVAAGALMLRKALRQSADGEEAEHSRKSWPVIVLVALAVGLVTGFFGVGGGFLIVPALTLVLGMPVRVATATALLVIVINSGAAMIPRAGEALDLTASIIVAVAAVVTTFLAARWSNKWTARSLGIGFGVLVLAMAGVTALEAWSLAAA